MALVRSAEVDPANRKLIRPSFNEMKEQRTPPPRKDAPQKKVNPPDQTNAENFYYIKQMQTKTPMTFVLRDGEVLKGVIEWYDKTCLRSTAKASRTCWFINPTLSTCTRFSALGILHESGT
jgi:hypothetical protein